MNRNNKRLSQNCNCPPPKKNKNKKRENVPSGHHSIEKNASSFRLCCAVWQNFQEEMASQPECAPWLAWSLEQVSVTLGRRFPGHHVWVVRASRMYLHKFSGYRHFVDSNMFGAPQHAPYSPDGGALRHLRLGEKLTFFASFIGQRGSRGGVTRPRVEIDVSAPKDQKSCEKATPAVL